MRGGGREVRIDGIPRPSRRPRKRFRRSSPRIALTSEDLPTFGRPMMASAISRGGAGSGALPAPLAPNGRRYGRRESRGDRSTSSSTPRSWLAGRRAPPQTDSKASFVPLAPRLAVDLVGGNDRLPPGFARDAGCRAVAREDPAEASTTRTTRSARRIAATARRAIGGIVLSLGR